MISIRNHCIPCSDELARMRKVKEIPSELDCIEQSTAGGIVKKFKEIVDSDYFASLPNSAIIVSGAIQSYNWSKMEVKLECDRIWSECKQFIY